MKLNIINHPFHYEMEKLTRIFFPNVPFSVVHINDETEDYIITEIIENKISVKAEIKGVKSEKSFVMKEALPQNLQERKMAVLLYEALFEITGYEPEWGILTGVRPAKLMSNLLSEVGEKKATEHFQKELKVNKEKTKLALIVSKKEKAITDLSTEKSFSIYVSVPFCPTRCSYCSFVSSANEQAKKLIPEYVKKLCEEIRYTGEIIKKFNLRLESVYYGGGTPTTFSADELAQVHKALSESFSLNTVKEYTVEAGRPDTITEQKLSAIKAMGATRISINPQTFNDEVLEAIGRKHSSEQTINAYNFALKMGYDNINMDLIAGLPKDTLESFKRSVDIAVENNPAGITVHTLALKRSSTIATEERETNSAVCVSQMLDYASEKLYNSGYEPYYMYRQSKCLGNFENVGWSKKGFECIYNVFMMEETHSVLAFGAGAVSKLRNPNSIEIERVFNFKYPYEYLSRFDEILQRKKQIEDFFSNS